MTKIGVADLVRVLKEKGIDVGAILERLDQDDAIELGPGGNADYVPRGSDQHAGLLGLARAESDYVGVTRDGWKLVDAMYTELDSDKLTERVLVQRVNELTSPIPETQSKDPRAPGFAPTMWDPRKDVPFRQNTE